MSAKVSQERHGAIALVYLDNPPVNALSHAVREGLLQSLASLLDDSAVRAIVIACRGRTFVAGADIREFGKTPQAPDVPELIERLDAASKPLVAAMHGTALGGGLELSLACHYRICASGTRLGLPEVTLGLLPGAGGTQRLPRLIGARAALDLIVSGALISATRALELGLIDAIVDADLESSALAFAAGVLERSGPLPRARERSAKLDDPKLFEEYRERVERTQRGFLAPLRCIEAVQAAVTLDFPAGLTRERQLFVELMESPESKAQRHAFFGERDVAKIPGVSAEVSPRPLRSLAVVGHGAAAAELVRCLARAELPLTLLAPASELERCMGLVREGYAQAVAQGALKAGVAEQQLASLRAASSREALADADLVIEAAPDQLAAKREALSQLAAWAKPGAILATSSAVFDVDALTDGWPERDSVLGMHLPRATSGGRLLEVIRGQTSASDACAAAMKLGKALGRIAVPLRAPLLHRLFEAVLREARSLEQGGTPLASVDQALFDFGFPPGWLHDGPLASAPAPRDEQPEATQARSEPQALSSSEIAERCVYALVNEAARVLQAGLAARPLDVDMVCLHGLGFPLYRGGPLFYADQVGLARIQRFYAGAAGKSPSSPATI